MMRWARPFNPRLAFSVLWAAACVPLACCDQLPIWPLPATATLGEKRLQVVPVDNFFTSELETDFLREAFGRYLPITFPHIVDNSSYPNLLERVKRPYGVTGLRITVDSSTDTDLHPQLETEESYTLDIKDCKSGCVATAHAATRYGALRALETFSQLVQFDFETGTYFIKDGPIHVRDHPRFPHRGILVDTGRHWLSIPELQRLIDSMPYAKLNVLHWHLVDTQSFPLQSKRRPKLWEGSFSQRERYTQAEVAHIVEYARLRGVRVMAELDVPGHAESWCVGYPHLCPSAGCKTPLNPAEEDTFNTIEELIVEVTGAKRLGGLFPESLMHLGGDEVELQCWDLVPKVNLWLEEMNMTSQDAYKYFVERVGDMARSRGRRPVYWSEVYDNFRDDLPKDTIIHVWKDVTNVTEVVEKGYSVLRNVGYTDDSWYLDNLAVKWNHIYENEPCQGIPERLCERILGGQGQMWGETVDGSDLENTIWPRMASVAEKLWSPRHASQSWEDALPRIEDFRCLLLQRGVAAAPVNNGIARSGPKGPGGCSEVSDWP